MKASSRIDAQKTPIQDRMLIERYLDSIWLEQHLSSHTLKAYRSDFYRLAHWLKDQKLDLHQASEKNLLDFFTQMQKDDYEARSIRRMISSLKGFFFWLYEKERRDDNPMALMQSPNPPPALPKTHSEEQIRKLLQAPDPGTPQGIRDRALLELLYAAGLRVSEAVELSLLRVDLTLGSVKIIGKGNRERLVPIGSLACEAGHNYLSKARPQLLKKHSLDRFFVGNRGGVLTRQFCWHLVSNYAASVGLPPTTPHDLRHAFASHLLDRGCDLRTLQVMLGHASLSTTQIYTHISRSKMIDWHRKHHPRG